MMQQEVGGLILGTYPAPLVSLTKIGALYNLNNLYVSLLARVAA